MAENSKIEWTDNTANFWWGCMKVSDGCKNCYAETLSNRYGKGIWGPATTTDRELKKGIWKNVFRWNAQAKKDGVQRRVFVQSMADFFENHPHVAGWRSDALKLIEECDSLIFQILTKRPENVSRMIEEATGCDPLSWFAENNPHVWIGVSVEDQQSAEERIPHLHRIPAAVRFLSCEPLLGRLELDGLIGYWDMTGQGRPNWRNVSFVSEMPVDKRIHWIIAGGESGPHARPMHPDWVRSLRDQCQAAGVSFFFKQWGHWWPTPRNTPTANASAQWVQGQWFVPYGKKASGRELDGREWSEFPA